MADPGLIHEWSADSLVRVFLASPPVRADMAVRAPIPALLEYALGRPHFGIWFLVIHWSLEISNRDFPLWQSSSCLKVWA